MEHETAQAPDNSVNSIATRSLREFSVFKEVFSTLNQGFTTDVQADQNDSRKLRRLEIDIEQMRQNSKLEAHETYIAVRVIDTNIKQKMPARLAYLKSSNRLAVFEPDVVLPGEPPVDTTRLENEFWRVMTYTDWEIPFIRATDGAEFVGYDWLKVLYTPQPDRPGNCSIEHVGRNNLLFDLSVSNIQDSKLIAERHPTTLVTLARLQREFKFQQSDVLKLRGKITELSVNTTVDDYDHSRALCLYRAFWKEDGIVWTSWYSTEIDHWLSEPVKFYNGVDTEVQVPIPPEISGTLEPQFATEWQPEEEQNYPFYLVVRNITEDKRIAQSVGAVAADYPVQEAACSLWSTYVNGAFLAGQTMWSPKGDAFDKTGAPKQLSLKFERGQIWDREMTAFNAPYPDASLTRTLNDLQQLNATQNNSIAWAVNNRQDSRKTATEVSAASQQQSQVNSSETLMLSIALRSVWAAAWRIVQAQALQNLIAFCPIAQNQNDIDLIARRYKVKAAGDTDYVEKNMRIAAMQQDWPIVQSTPAAMPFLEDYLNLRYPDKAAKYIAAIKQGEQQNAQINEQRKALLKEAVTDDAGQLLPEFQPHAQQVQQLLQ